MRALRDFHYESLDVAIDGALDGDLAARLDLRGSSPDVEAGRANELRVLRAIFVGNAVVDRIRERLLERAAEVAVRRRESADARAKRLRAPRLG